MILGVWYSSSNIVSRIYKIECDSKAIWVIIGVIITFPLMPNHHATIATSYGPFQTKTVHKCHQIEQSLVASWGNVTFQSSRFLTLSIWSPNDVESRWGCHLIAWISLGPWLRHLLLGPAQSCIQLSTYLGHMEAMFTLFITPQWHRTHLHYIAQQSMLPWWFFLLAGLGACFTDWTTCSQPPSQAPVSLPILLASPQPSHEDPVVTSHHTNQPLGPAQGKPSEKHQNHEGSKRELAGHHFKEKNINPEPSNKWHNGFLSTYCSCCLMQTWKAVTSPCINKRQPKVSLQLPLQSQLKT